jgi:hypothetical protein
MPPLRAGLQGPTGGDQLVTDSSIAGSPGSATAGRELGTDDETLPAFKRTAAELETRIGFLLEAIKHTTDSQEVIEHA